MLRNNWPKYIVTYCKQGTELGSNPLEHACLVLSKWEGPDHQLEVINSWGFYSQKPDPDGTAFIWYLGGFLFEKVKKSAGIPFDPKGLEKGKAALFNKVSRTIGINFDLMGNYGDLRQEKLRFFDQAVGLEGISFQISAEQAGKLINICEKMTEDQHAAIEEAKAYFASRGNKTPTSKAILEYEEDYAKAEGRESRLKRFEIKPALSKKTILSFGESTTCKTTAVDILDQIGVDQTYLHDLLKRSRAFPRFSGKLEPFLLHSRGQKHQFTDPVTGKISLYRQWGAGEDAGKLYWTLPPQLLVSEDPDLDIFKLPHPFGGNLKSSIQKLQKLERLFEYEKSVNKVENCGPLKDKIRALYEVFAKIGTLKTQEEFEKHLNKIQSFFSDLDWAMHDEWSDSEEEESAVNRLPESTQREIYKILGLRMLKTGMTKEELKVQERLSGLSEESQNKVRHILGLRMFGQKKPEQKAEAVVKDSQHTIGQS